MFTSFDEQTFWQAIAQKDYLCLKVNTVSAILNDPTFDRGEVQQVLQILHQKVPEIFVSEVHLPYEERLDQSAWNKDYFTKLVFWFQENFAESRLAYIKRVGKTVHADTARAYAASAAPKKTVVPPPAAPIVKQQPAERIADSVQTSVRTPEVVPNPRQAPEQVPPKAFPLGAITAVAALVLVVILLVLWIQR